MNKRFHAVPWIVGITAGLMLALCSFPTARVIIKLQVEAAILRLNNIFFVHNLSEVAKQNPNDMDIQIGSLLATPDYNLAASQEGINKNDILNEVSQLVSRYPEQPAVYAVAIRLLSKIPLMTDRDNDQTLPPDLNKEYSQTPIDKSYLLKFDSLCKKGALLDPNNAYFPFMRSISLFALKRDSDALNEIKIAGDKNTYNDYTSYEMTCINRFTDAAWGAKVPFLREFGLMGLIFPDYSQMRASARVAIHTAILLERKGDLNAGYAIRRDVRRFGSLMTTNSTMIIGNLVGGAIAKLAMNYFPGAPSKAQPYFNDTNRQYYLKPYMHYLETIHHSSEAMACEKQVAALNTVFGIVHAEMQNDITTPLRKTITHWLAGMVLLLCAFWIVVFWIASFLIYRIPQFNISSSNKDLLKGISILIPVSLMFYDLFCFKFIRMSGMMPIIESTILVVTCIILIAWIQKSVLNKWSNLDKYLFDIWTVVFIIYFIYRIYIPGTVLSSNNAFLVAMLIIVFLILEIMNNKGYKITNTLNRSSIIVYYSAISILLFTGMYFISKWQAGGIISNLNFLNQFIIDPFTDARKIFVIAVIIPEIVAATFVISSIRSKAHLFKGISKGIRAVSPYLACLALIIWGASVLMTIRTDRGLYERQKIFETGESQYYARLSHIPWPSVGK